MFPWGEINSLDNHLNLNNVSVYRTPPPILRYYRSAVISPCGESTFDTVRPCGECLRQSLWGLNTVHPCGELLRG
jgi:hypothetical protein